jgi:hypothetical protein
MGIFLAFSHVAHADPLVVTNGPPSFTLDTCLPVAANQTALVVQTETPMSVSASPLVATAESVPFKDDMRLVAETVPQSVMATAESFTFQLDTPLPAGKLTLDEFQKRAAVHTYVGNAANGLLTEWSSLRF